MKILFLPLNIASLPFITAKALNKVGGVEAKVITNLVSPIQSRGENTIVIPKKFPRKKPVQWLYHKLTYKARIKKWIKWADVLHYTFEPAFDDGKDLELAFNSGKSIFVEWVGSDIRNPEYLSRINNYYAKAFKEGYEYFELESSNHSVWVQTAFSKVKAKALVNPEMSLFLDKTLFPEGPILTMPRMNIADFAPKYPETNNSRPLIIHSPSARVCKGTKYILKAIEELKPDYDFEFRLIENMPREKALELMAKCDIFIDQLILGSYGLASIEAMSFGKPVICNIMPEVFSAGLPSECPITIATPDSIKTQLENLLKSPAARHESGKKGRSFVEKFHDADKIVQDLLKLYKSDLQRLKNRSI